MTRVSLHLSITVCMFIIITIICKLISRQMLLVSSATKMISQLQVNLYSIKPQSQSGLLAATVHCRSHSVTARLAVSILQLSHTHTHTHTVLTD